MLTVRSVAVILLGAAVLAQEPLTPDRSAAPTKQPRPPVVGTDRKGHVMPPGAQKTPVAANLATASHTRVGMDGPVRQSATASDRIPDAVRRAIVAEVSDPDLVVFDSPAAEGELWARGRNYKVRFGAREWAFIAQPGSPNMPGEPVGFELMGCEVGASILPLRQRPGRVHRERSVEYRHSSLVERIDVSGGRVEQSFRFDDLPERGELRLRIATTGARLAGAVEGGLQFVSPATAKDIVTYSAAVAIDARGRRQSAPTQVVDGEIRIAVPAAFVDSCELPLIVDPIVASANVPNGNNAYSSPDIAWDHTTQSFTVVYERFFSIDDIDVYATRLGYNMNALGGTTVVDGSGEVWRAPKIANNNLADRHIVVAQVSDDAPPPTWIEGRILDAAGGVATGQFPIAKAGEPGHIRGNKTNPDVGGDPANVGPTYFTVVFESAHSSTNHDIHMKQVATSGTLRSLTSTVIDSSGSFERRPSISNSNGPPPFSDQRHVVVYEREFNSNDSDIRAALLTWDGQFVQVQGSNNFPVNSSFANDVRPAVSSPTEGTGNGERHALIAFERTGSGNGDVFGVITTKAGVLFGTANLSQLESSVRAPLSQRNVAVETDGVRFAVVYDERPTTPSPDVDARVGFFGIDFGSSAIEAHEAVAVSNSSAEDEVLPAIASVYAGLGIRTTGFGIAVESGNSTPTVDAFLYDGRASGGGWGYRSISCGPARISHTPAPPVIGRTLDFSVSGSGASLSGVIVGFPQPITPVPGCPSCDVGVTGSVVFANPFAIAIPPDASFVGITLAVQGFQFGNGPCYGTLSVSDVVFANIQ